MIKRLIKFIICVMFSAICVGCVSNVEFVNSNEEISNQAILFENVVQALSNSNYSLIENHLSSELKKSLTKDDFNQMVKALERNGKIVKFVFLDKLRYPAIPSEIWKVTFAKINENKEMEYRDKLVKVTYTELDGRRQIIAIAIQ